MMQHKSNMISQMMGGSKGVSSLSGIMGGTARMQARAITRQYDTFERLSDLGYKYSGGRGSGSESADDVDLSSANGTAREQAKKIMENYDNETAKADGAAAAEGKKADDTPKADGGEPTQRSKSAAYNTDKVDAEIKRLREQKQQFEKQLQSASDPRQAVMLQKQIFRLEKELQQKDNDAYRREHAEKSE
jgi:TATA-binding protein-associated factor Taf7